MREESMGLYLYPRNHKGTIENCPKPRRSFSRFHQYDWLKAQHLSSNSHGRELRFLFILEAQAGPGTHAIYLEDYTLILTKIKNLVLMQNGYVHPWLVQRPGSEILSIL
jgi:hypothetical protein